MDSSLVGKGGAADKGLVGRLRQVGDFGDMPGYFGQPRKLFVGNTIDPHFQFQDRNNRTEVGVAAALAQTVDCPLNMAYAAIDRHFRYRNRAFRIVVGMDPERFFYFYFYFAYNSLRLVA